MDLAIRPVRGALEFLTLVGSLRRAKLDRTFVAIQTNKFQILVSVATGVDHTRHQIRVRKARGSQLSRFVGTLKLVSVVVGSKCAKLDRALLPAQSATFQHLLGLAPRSDHTRH